MMRFAALALTLSACAHRPPQAAPTDPLLLVGSAFMLAGAGAHAGLAYPRPEATWRDCVAASVIADVCPRLGMAILSRGIAPQVYEVDLQRCMDGYGVPSIAELSDPATRRDLDDAIGIALDVAGLNLTPRLDDCAQAVSAAARDSLRGLAPSLLAALADPTVAAVVAWPGLPSGVCP